MQFCTADGQEASGFPLYFILLSGDRAPRSAECGGSQETVRFTTDPPACCSGLSAVVSVGIGPQRHFSWEAPLSGHLVQLAAQAGHLHSQIMAN